MFAERLPNALTFFVFTTVTVLFYFIAPSLFLAYEVPSHIVSGDLIRNLGDIPATEPFSYGTGDYPWLNVSWGFDVVLSLLHQYLGPGSLVGFSIVLIALSVSLIYLNCYKRHVSMETMWIVTGMVAIVLAFSLSARPHLVTFVMLPLFHGVLHKVREDASARAYFLPVLMVLWANMHDGFLYGLILITAYLFDAYYSERKDLHYRFGLILILCILASLINPLGWQIYEVFARAFGTSVLTAVAEMQPPRVMVVVGYGVFVIVFALVANVRNENIPLADKFISYLWLVLGLSMTKYFPIFALVAAPYLAVNLNRFKHKQNADLIEITDKKECRLGAFLFSLFFLLAFLFLTQTMLKRDDIMIPSGDVYLTELGDVSRWTAENFSGNHVFTEIADSGRVLYFSKGKLRTFLDSRLTDAFPPEVLNDYATLADVKEGWEEVLQKYKVSVFILPTESKLSVYLHHSGYARIVKETEEFKVLVTNT